MLFLYLAPRASLDDVMHFFGIFDPLPSPLQRFCDVDPHLLTRSPRPLSRHGALCDLWDLGIM